MRKGKYRVLRGGWKKDGTIYILSVLSRNDVSDITKVRMYVSGRYVESASLTPSYYEFIGSMSDYIRLCNPS